MAINLASFLGHGPKDTFYGNMLSHADRAAKSAYEPQRQEQEVRQLELMNALRQAQAPYAEQREKAELENTLANTQKINNSNFAGGELIGDLGNVAKLYQLEQKLGPDNPLVQELKKHLERQELTQDLRNQQLKSINNTRSFAQLPANEKSLLLGKLRAANVPDQDIERIKNNEIGLEDYLVNEKGWEPEDVHQIIPNQAPTGATQSTVQQVKGALAEDAYIGPKITEALSPYSQKIFGFSPEQVVDELDNNESTLDQRARALAARALVPEIAGYRTRIAGGSEAHKALSELTESSLNQLKIFNALVSPEEYSLAQKYIHEWQQGMGQARVRGLQGIEPSSKQSPLKNVAEALEKNTPSAAFEVNGQLYNIPPDKIEAFKKKFPEAKKK